MDRIKELRQNRGMKQTELAGLLNCAAMTVSRYERGEADPDVDTILRLCDIFGCTADYLLGRSPLPSPNLSEEEAELVQAFRAADQNRRDLVRLTLEPFRQEHAEEKAV